MAMKMNSKIHLKSVFCTPLLALLALTTLMLLQGCGAAGESKPEVRLFIWGEYMNPEVLEAFEEETGIRVIESNYSSNEEMLAKVQASSGEYDVVVPSDFMVRVMKRRGLLAELDPDRLTLKTNIAERFTNLDFDPGLKYCVPYHYGVTGIGYNVQAFQDRPAPTSWSSLFDLKEVSRFKGKTSLLNDQREAIGAALIYLGYPSNTLDEQELAEASDLLKKQKEFIGKYDSDSFEDTLAAGTINIAQGWSGELAIAMKENDDIRFFIPEEGALMFVDTLAVLESSPRKELAFQFINYLLRPDVAAQIANFVSYASANAKAEPMIEESLKNGPAYMAPPEDRTYYIQDLEEKEEAYERIWTELKAE
jgi:spermidine/putrescine transport system substrate-binding protein